MPSYLASISAHRQQQLAAIERRYIRQTAALLVAITIALFFIAISL